MNKLYGQSPILIGNIKLEPSEMCFVQYLPIKMSINEKLGVDIKIPPNLLWAKPLVDMMCQDIKDEQYLYLTVKHLYVVPENMGNRPGWHSDGFQTNDLNYIWTDKFPTEFCVQDFILDEDCTQSMIDMSNQVKEENIITFKEYDFLKLDQFNIHRSPEIGFGYRTFVKLSLSEDKYNLKGNAHNYLFDYNWELLERQVDRNHPHQK